MIDKIQFSLFGLELLEPMSFVTNMLVVFVCLIGVKAASRQGVKYWKGFFLFYAIASFIGALSHIFWNYWAYYGKILPWLFGVVATSFLVFEVLGKLQFFKKNKNLLLTIILFKGGLVLFLAYTHWNFIFVAIDTIASLLVSCGFIGAYLVYNKGLTFLKYMFYGVLIILPSAFVFLFQIDLHQYFNREDLSHIIIALGLLLFIKTVRDYPSEAASSILTHE
jgi:hypothetical protein